MARCRGEAAHQFAIAMGIEAVVNNRESCRAIDGSQSAGGITMVGDRLIVQAESLTWIALGTERVVRSSTPSVNKPDAGSALSILGRP
jgi:hypothetical protein